MDEPHSEVDHASKAVDELKLDRESVEAADIRIEEAKRIRIEDYLETTGVVSPNESRLAHIRPLSRGVVEKVYVTLGSRVRRGQALIRYDIIELGEGISDYLGQQATLRETITQRELALRFLERGRDLIEAEVIAQRDLELLEAEYKNAEETAKRRRAELLKTKLKLRRFGLAVEDLAKLTEESQVHDLQKLSHNVLRAPFDGVVITYEAVVGEYVHPEEVLLTIVDLSAVWLLADVYERDIAQVRPDSPARIVFGAYPDRLFDGTVTYVGDVLDPATRTVKVRCEVSNPRHLLKLGMFATIQIPRKTGREAVVVPVAAIQRVEGRTVLFVEMAVAHFQLREVKLGSEQNGFVAIEEGLQAGERVVTQGTFSLKSELLRGSIPDEHGH